MKHMKISYARDTGTSSCYPCSTLLLHTNFEIPTKEKATEEQEGKYQRRVSVTKEIFSRASPFSSNRISK